MPLIVSRSLIFFTLVLTLLTGHPGLAEQLTPPGTETPPSAEMPAEQPASKLFIARGDTGSALPTDTLLATATRFNAAEQQLAFCIPVVLSKDGVVMVSQDIAFPENSNVAALFPDRKHDDDGKFYFIDFTADEIAGVRISTKASAADQKTLPLRLPIPTLSDELNIIRIMQQQSGIQPGIYIELRKPWFHTREKMDLSQAVVTLLSDFGYSNLESGLSLQTFDPDELKRIHDELLPQASMQLALIQLIDIGDGDETRQEQFGEWLAYDYEWLFTNTGLRMISSYASGLSFPAQDLINPLRRKDRLDYLTEAARGGLQLFVHDFPRLDTSAQAGPASWGLISLILNELNFTGIYSAFPHEASAAYGAWLAMQQRKADLPAFFSNLNLARPAASSASTANEDNAQQMQGTQGQQVLHEQSGPTQSIPETSQTPQVREGNIEIPGVPVVQ